MSHRQKSLFPNGARRHLLKVGSIGLFGISLPRVLQSAATQGLRPGAARSCILFSGKPGLYLVTHTLDHVVHYAPIRSIKSAKTFFVVSQSLDRVAEDNPGFDQVLGHPLELVAETNPVRPMGPGQPIRVKLLYKGKSMSNTRVSFIPQGHALNEGFDGNYERMTDSAGQASFTPKTGNVYLVVAHYKEPNESGENYESTKYSATLTVFVPEIFPCCGE